ncbi:MAG: PhoH family protein [Bacillota bacterium]
MNDQNLKLIEKALNVRIFSRGNELTIKGEPDNVARATRIVERLKELSEYRDVISSREVMALLMSEAHEDEAQRTLGTDITDVITFTLRGKPIRPIGPGQKQYVEAMSKFSLVFGIGPAGTGKTYLAVAMAVRAFRNREVARIILTRPAVEAGEKLGFLPGTIEEKVNPYLRPLYDALFDILGMDTFEKYLGKGLIEVAPLAYMRGRTLDDSFIILDEAQNTTPEQMKMFLTRMGMGSRVVVTGDITQIDLPKGQYSGLQQARVVLRDVEGIAFVYLSDRDVVRHELVQKIIKAYEKFDSSTNASES